MNSNSCQTADAKGPCGLQRERPCRHPDRAAALQARRELISNALSTVCGSVTSALEHHTGTCFPSYPTLHLLSQRGFPQYLRLSWGVPSPTELHMTILVPISLLLSSPSCLLRASACHSTIQVPDTLSHWVGLREEGDAGTQKSPSV